MAKRTTFGSKKPAETGGPRASNRIDYQKDWTLSHILELHASGKEYVVVCDYYDDVVVLDSYPPTEANFYQIKTRDTGDWTIVRLAHCELGKNGILPSILGKMLKHRIEHPEITASINLVSNARYGMDLDDGGSAREMDRVAFHELHSNERKQASDKVQVELALSSPPDFGTTTNFIVSQLSLGNHDTHARGILSAYLEQAFGEAADRSVGAAYRVLYDEIKRKSNREGLFDLSELIKNKGITRASIDRTLRAFAARDMLRDAWPQVKRTLEREDVPISQLLLIESFWMRYLAERTDKTNEPLQRLCDRIASGVASAILTKPTRMIDIADMAISSVPQDPMWKSDYMRAMAILEMTANEHPAIQAARAELEKAAT